MAQTIPQPISRQPGKETGSAPAEKAVFTAILSDDIEWKSVAAHRASVRLAVVVGQISEPGPYTIRVKVPHGVKLMPHRHTENRVYTAI